MPFSIDRSWPVINEPRSRIAMIALISKFSFLLLIILAAYDEVGQEFYYEKLYFSSGEMPNLGSVLSMMSTYCCLVHALLELTFKTNLSGKYTQLIIPILSYAFAKLLLRRLWILLMSLVAMASRTSSGALPTRWANCVSSTYATAAALVGIFDSKTFTRNMKTFGNRPSARSLKKNNARYFR